MHQPIGNECEAKSIDSEGVEYFAFANGYSLLSNYHYTPFTLEGVRYLSVEQYLWAQKALLAKDYEAYQNIMDERASSRYKDIKIKNLSYDRWNAIRSQHLMAGLDAKFAQCHRASEKLRATGSASLVHATIRDRIYGTGLDIGDVNNMSPNKWLGLNELGKSLMAVRSTLA